MNAPAVSPSEYNEFLRSVQPREVRLARAGVEAPAPYGEEQLQVRVELGDSRFESTEDGFMVWQTGRFAGLGPDDEEVIVVEAEFELRYTSERPMTEAIFEVFQEINLPVNVWPYLREFFQQATLRAGWPGFVLPAFQSGLPSRARPDPDGSSR